MDFDINTYLKKIDDSIKNLEDGLSPNSQEETISQNYDALIHQYELTKEKKYLENLLDIIDDQDEKMIIKYLSTKIDNKTILEIAIDERIYLNFNTRKSVFSNLELLKIVIEKKYDNIIYVADEEDLLIKLEEKTLMEHFIENEMLDKYNIDKICENTLVIDLLMKYNKQNCFSGLSEEILFCDYKGKKVIDFLFENNYVDDKIVEKIQNHTEIYDYIIKYKKNNLLKHINERLLTKQVNGKYIFDILAEQNISPKITDLYDNKLFEMIIQNQRYDLLINVSKYDLMLNKPDPNKSLFEFLLNQNIIATKAIDAITNNSSAAKFFLDIISKYNKFDLLKNSNEKALLSLYIDDKTLLEILLENKIEPTLRSYREKQSIEILIKYNNYEELKKVSEEYLAYKLPNGKMIFEELIEKNQIPKTIISNPELVKKIFELNKKELYSSIKTTALLNYYDLNITYLEKILIEHKETDDIDLTNLIGDAKIPNEKAQAYIIYAKYNKHMYLPSLDKKDLLKKDNTGKRLIDSLLEIDKDITINNLIHESIKEDLEIAMILNLQGINQPMKFDSITETLEEKYLEDKRKEYEALPLTEEQEQLLQKLYDVMNDGKSDPQLVSSLIASYRNLLATNNKYAYEIYHLINIKQNDEFTYQKISTGAYFFPNSKYIGMDDSNMGTLNHETGHAMYYYLTDRQLPEELELLFEKLRRSEEFLEKTSQYSNKFHYIVKKVSEKIENEFMVKYDESITEEKKKEIQNYLDNLKNSEKEKYIQMGYSEELLNKIISNSFTVEEYIKQDRKIKKSNLIDLFLKTKYGAFISIGDCLDGIYQGKFQGGLLVDKNGNKIKGAYGHGISYYSRGIDWAFDEMIANYSSIIKGENPEKGLKYLEEYLGKELTSLLIEYYDTNILQSKKYLEETINL